jgi:hypothetical protein
MHLYHSYFSAPLLGPSAVVSMRMDVLNVYYRNIHIFGAMLPFLTIFIGNDYISPLVSLSIKMCSDVLFSS